MRSWMLSDLRRSSHGNRAKPSGNWGACVAVNAAPSRILIILLSKVSESTGGREGVMGRNASVVRYAVAAAAISWLCGSAAQAAALKIDPRCAKFSDKLGCTCALLNGGRIYTEGARTHWASARGTNNGRPSNQAFTQCIIDHGGH